MKDFFRTVAKVLGVCWMLVAAVFAVVSFSQASATFAGVISVAMGAAFLAVGVLGILPFKKKRRKRLSKTNNKPDDLKINTSESKEKSRNARGELDVDHLNNHYQEQSNAIRVSRQNKIQQFDVSKISIHTGEPAPLTYPERYFLKHISTQPVKRPHIQGYWYYDYGLEYTDCVTMFIAHRYLTTADGLHDLTFLSIEMLKKILAENGLPINGNKRVLAARIQENIGNDDIEEYIGESSQFRLTEGGEAVTRDLPKSITKDIDMEDKCIEYLINDDVVNAYKRVCEFKAQKKHLAEGDSFTVPLSRELCEIYTQSLNSDLNGKIPSDLMQYSALIKACIVLVQMLGQHPSSANTLLFRITGIRMRL